MSKAVGGAMLAGLLGVVGLRDAWLDTSPSFNRQTALESPQGVFRAMAYQPDTRLLTLEFRNGYAYRYRDVPGSVYADFMRSSNPGTFYNERIRRRYAMERAPDRCLTRSADEPVPGPRRLAATARRIAPPGSSR